MPQTEEGHWFDTETSKRQVWAIFRGGLWVTATGNLVVEVMHGQYRPETFHEVTPDGAVWWLMRFGKARDAQRMFPAEYARYMQQNQI